jgi:hypothetical protein
MRLVELVLVYGLVGVGCVVAVFVRSPASRTPLDGLLLFAMWPLYTPFALMSFGAGGRTAPRLAASSRAGAFVAALDRARSTPLADLLPDAAAAAALSERLDNAESRVAEIDRLLDDPDFDEAAAAERRAAFEASGDRFGASTAASRIQNIARLRRMRDHYDRELRQIEELLSQLRTQAEVVRLAGAMDDGTRDLVVDLIARLEGLDEVLDCGPGLVLRQEA